MSTSAEHCEHRVPQHVLDALYIGLFGVWVWSFSSTGLSILLHTDVFGRISFCTWLELWFLWIAADLLLTSSSDFLAFFCKVYTVGSAELLM
jgi:hypothetical protein